MIVGDIKPLEEIAGYLNGYSHVVVIGCDGCVSVCLSGGFRNAEALVLALDHPRYTGLRQITFTAMTILRQCERDMVQGFLSLPQGVEAVISMACGAGVQTMAECLEIPVFPALNTTFLGSLDDFGNWVEKCKGCGECILAYTGGICPIARCAKRLFNGPCGGSSKGKCEIGEDVDCAWHLIIQRLKVLGRLDDYMALMDIKDWAKAGSGGPRSLRRAIPQI